MSDQVKMQGVLEKGYGIIPKMLMQDESIDIEGKAIYAYFASYAGGGQSAFPGIEKILHDLKISENRFYKYRKQLIDRGYINVQPRRKENNFGKEVRDSNLYILNTLIPQHLQNEGIQNEGIQNEDLQNEGIQNEGHNSNSLNNNSSNNNSKKSNTSNSNSSGTSTLYSYYEQMIGRLITPLEAETLNSYIQDGLSEDVIKYSIDEAVERNARNMKYIKGILNRCLDQGKTELHHLSKKDGDSSGMYDFSRKQDSENNKGKCEDEFKDIDF